MRTDPESLRTAFPAAWPQYPHDETPQVREQSQPRYRITSDLSLRVAMRDGVQLAVDVFRPLAPGDRFPVLIASSPYGRQLQRTDVAVAQNEAGITEFWVPRGFVHVIVDVRGSNDSQGKFDLSGALEQADLVEVVQWALAQPWCSGKVGMVGCSYFGRTQLLLAANACPGLTAIFPYDAGNDAYRDTYYHGGIPSSGYVRNWFTSVLMYNGWSGRQPEMAAMLSHFNDLMAEREIFDGAYYQERSSYPRLADIRIPTYMGSDWSNHGLHLRGAYNAWEGLPGPHKKLLIGPHPTPRRPFAAYHFEALRWYDLWLKGMDTGVLESPPVNLYVQGENKWRSAAAWPLPETDWQRWSLCEGGALAPSPGRAASSSYTCATPQWATEPPGLVYRSRPLDEPMEITGPIGLTLVAKSSAADTDWFVQLYDESPDGGLRLLTRGWLRASHREIDPLKSRSFQPWHPHLRAEPLEPGTRYAFEVEVVGTSNLFLRGHRIRLTIASSERPSHSGMHTALLNGATNTVFEGLQGSTIELPMIPRA